MIEALLIALINIVIFVGVVFLVIWVIEYLGLTVPEKIKKVIYLVTLLVVLLILYRTFVVGSALPIRL